MFLNKVLCDKTYFILLLFFFQLVERKTEITVGNFLWTDGWIIFSVHIEHVLPVNTNNIETI